MKKIIFIIGFIFISCRSSPEASFNNLKEAFIKWYFRYNPVESTKFNLYNHHNNYKSFGNIEREEYLADISRFLIELSQIDETKLNNNNRVDYNMLYT